MKTVYFILGMHRSGTSALTGVLNLAGMDVGTDLMPSTDDNKNGYFENYKVFWFNEKVLSDYGSAWDDNHFSTNDINKNDLENYISEAKKILKSEYKFTENVLIKDPRNCLLFPIWEQACSELKYKIKVIIPYRSPLEVAESLRKRDDISYEKSLIIWAHHFLSAELYSRNYKRMFIYFDDLLEDTENSIKNLEEFTDEKVNQNTKKKILEFLNPKYKHNNYPLNNFSKQTPEFLQFLINWINQKKFEDLTILDGIRTEFYRNLYLFQHDEIQGSLIKLEDLKLLNKEQKDEIKTINERQVLSENHITNIESLNNQLENSIEDIKEELENEKISKAEFENKNNELTTDFQELTNRLSSSEKEINELKSQLQAQLTEFKQLKSQYINEQEQQRLSIKHIANIEDLLKIQEKEKSKIIKKHKNKILRLKNKIKQTSIDNSKHFSELQKSVQQLSESVNEKDINIKENNNLHLKTINEIGNQVSKIKATAIHAVNIYSESWINKTKHDELSNNNVLNNLQQFYNLYNLYVTKTKNKRNELYKKLIQYSSRVNTLVRPKKMQKIINQIKCIEADQINIEKKLNQLPWTFIQYFDEVSYLEVNSDVAEQVKIGAFSSGLEHFIFFGYDEVKYKGRRLSPHVKDYTEKSNLKSKEDIEYHFLNYLENCYKTNVVTVHNPAIAAIEAFKDLEKLATIKNPNNILAIDITKEIQAPIIIEDEITPAELSETEQDVYTYIEPIINKEIETQIESFEIQPLISIIMPVYNVDPKWLDLAIQSIENQWYKNWELCIVDDNSSNLPTLDFLKAITNEKIRIHYSKTNGNISIASNTALLMTKGDYIALMDNDDELTPDALYEMVKVINKNGAEFIYSDEDKLEMDGTFCDPHFKPDYSPDLLLSQNYMSHLGVIKKELMIKSNGFSKGLEGAQDYDLYLKVLEKTDKIYHVPKVLYHWRKVPGSTAAEFSEKSYAQDAGVLALKRAIKRRKLKATALNGKYPGTYRVKYAIQGNPLISIVVPFKDKPELLKMCLESILEKSTYKNFEVIGMSNNSELPETMDMMKKFEAFDSRIKFYEYNQPFNFSEINNYAVNQYANGEHIILLNNDIEIISPDWIESMLEHSQREEVGAVGAKLYYPNDTIQHAGVIVGIGGVAGHSHKYFERSNPGYFTRLDLIQNLSAVTAACLMVKTQVFKEVKGLNEEHLKIAFNDIDFCLRIRELNYLIVVTPYCEAYHHESISRGHEDTDEKQSRFNSEVYYMQSKHNKILNDGDPYYNKNLTLEHENFELK